MTSTCPLSLYVTVLSLALFILAQNARHNRRRPKSCTAAKPVACLLPSMAVDTRRHIWKSESYGVSISSCALSPHRVRAHRAAVNTSKLERQSSTGSRSSLPFVAVMRGKPFLRAPFRRMPLIVRHEPPAELGDLIHARPNSPRSLLHPARPSRTPCLPQTTAKPYPLPLLSKSNRSINTQGSLNHGRAEGVGEAGRRVRTVGEALTRSSPPLNNVRHHARTTDPLQALQTSERRDHCLGCHLKNATRQRAGGRAGGNIEDSELVCLRQVTGLAR